MPVQLHKVKSVQLVINVKTIQCMHQLLVDLVTTKVVLDKHHALNVLLVTIAQNKQFLIQHYIHVLTNFIVQLELLLQLFARMVTYALVQNQLHKQL